MITTNELKLCPFCRSRAQLFHTINMVWWAQCSICKARTSKYSSRAKAIAAWNMRADYE